MVTEEYICCNNSLLFFLFTDKIYRWQPASFYPPYFYTECLLVYVLHPFHDSVSSSLSTHFSWILFFWVWIMTTLRIILDEISELCCMMLTFLHLKWINLHSSLKVFFSFSFFLFFFFCNYIIISFYSEHPESQVSFCKSSYCLFNSSSSPTPLGLYVHNLL